MFYLIKDGVVVDKKAEKFPVHESLQWIQSDEDLPLIGKIKYESGKLVQERSVDDEIEFLIEQKNKLDELTKTFLHQFMMGEDSSRASYQTFYSQIVGAKTIEELMLITFD